MPISSTTPFFTPPGVISREYNSTEELRIPVVESKSTIQNNNQHHQPLLRRRIVVVQEESCWCTYIRYNIIWIPICTIGMLIATAFC
jgi:hypothetical protein